MSLLPGVKEGTYTDAHNLSDIGLFDHFALIINFKGTGIDHGRNLDISAVILVSSSRQRSWDRSCIQ
jgi:hypothetical protein